MTGGLLVGWNPEVVDVARYGSFDGLPFLQNHVSEVQVLAENRILRDHVLLLAKFGSSNRQPLRSNIQFKKLRECPTRQVLKEVTPKERHLFQRP